MKRFLVFFLLLFFCLNVFAYTTVSFDINTDTTWTSGNTYLINTKGQVSISIENNAKLTIQPNVFVKFSDGNYMHTNTGAMVVMQGTSAQPIVFTSCKDQTQGENTSAEFGCNAVPTPSRYPYGLLIGADAGVDADSNNFNDVNFAYAETALEFDRDFNSLDSITVYRGGSTTAVIWINGAAVNLYHLKNSSFVKNSGKSIGGTGTVLNIYDNVFSDNTRTVISGNRRNEIFRNAFLRNDVSAINKSGAAINGGATLIRDNNFFGNIASGASGGGAIVITGDSNIYGNRFEDNNAWYHGGAISIEGGDVNVFNNLFLDNNAGNGGGGGIYFSNLTGSIFNNTFVNNWSADGTGEAIKINGGTLNFIFNNIFAYHALAVHKTGGTLANFNYNAYWQNDVNCSGVACGLNDVNFTADPFIANNLDNNWLVKATQFSIVKDASVALEPVSYFQDRAVGYDMKADKDADDIGFHFAGAVVNEDADLNVSGDLNTFGYLLGGSDVNLVFSVYDVDNVAQDFLIDFNISLTPRLGSGTAIFSDLNLSMDFNLDTNSLSAPVDFNWTWAGVSLLDANYFACVNLLDKVNDENFGACGALSFLIDSTKPFTFWNKDSNSWYASNQTFSLTCYDNNSGCGSTKYRYKQLTPVLGSFIAWQTYSSPVVMDVEGKFHVDFNSTDNAGNVGDLNTWFFFLDKTRPVVSSDVNDDAWNLLGDANLQMSAYDLISGIDYNWWRYDDDNTVTNNWSSLLPFDQNIFLTWDWLGDGNFGVQYFATDATGWDSNSDANSNTHYVLFDVNGPEWPTSVSPISGNYVNNITITCSKQIWVRDLNYVIDFNTSTLDWNTLYIGPNNFHTFNTVYLPANTKAWFRCKHIDADKNSGYFTSSTNVVLEADTLFDSVLNALPSSNTTIYSASAAFSVDANDSEGVDFCTFEIYKNLALVGDFNGDRPIADKNIGTWTYTYSNIVNGDTIYAWIYCQDGAGNDSAKISSATYSASIAPPTPPPGGGGGGGVATEPFEVVSPSTVTGFLQTMVLGQEKELVIEIKNKSLSSVGINVGFTGPLAKFVSLDKTSFILPSGESTEIPFTVSIPSDLEIEDSFIEIEGLVTLSSASQIETVPVRIAVYSGLSLEPFFEWVSFTVSEVKNVLQVNWLASGGLAFVFVLGLFSSFRVKNPAAKGTLAVISLLGFIGLGGVFLL